MTEIQEFNTMVPKTHQACQKLLRFKSQPKGSSERLRGAFKSLLASKMHPWSCKFLQTAETKDDGEDRMTDLLF